MKFYNIQLSVIKKEVLIPYKEVRNTLKWGSAVGIIKIINLDSQHIQHIINSLTCKNNNKLGRKYYYKEYTYTQWIAIFNLELKFRKLQEQIRLNNIENRLIQNRIDKL